MPQEINFLVKIPGFSSASCTSTSPLLTLQEFRIPACTLYVVRKDVFPCIPALPPAILPGCQLPWWSRRLRPWWANRASCLFLGCGVYNMQYVACCVPCYNLSCVFSGRQPENMSTTAGERPRKLSATRQPAEEGKNHAQAPAVAVAHSTTSRSIAATRSYRGSPPAPTCARLSPSVLVCM